MTDRSDFVRGSAAFVVVRTLVDEGIGQGDAAMPADLPVGDLVVLQQADQVRA